MFHVEGLVINGTQFSGTHGPVTGTLVCNAGNDSEVALNTPASSTRNKSVTGLMKAPSSHSGTGYASMAHDEPKPLPDTKPSKLTHEVACAGSVDVSDTCFRIHARIAPVKCGTSSGCLEEIKLSSMTTGRSSRQMPPACSTLGCTTRSGYSSRR
jgi:hypothetical protein